MQTTGLQPCWRLFSRCLGAAACTNQAMASGWASSHCRGRACACNAAQDGRQGAWLDWQGVQSALRPHAAGRADDTQRVVLLPQRQAHERHPLKPVWPQVLLAELCHVSRYLGLQAAIAGHDFQHPCQPACSSVPHPAGLTRSRLKKLGHAVLASVLSNAMKVTMHCKMLFVRLKSLETRV